MSNSEVQMGLAELLAAVEDAQVKIDRAAEQITILSHKQNDLRIRYKRAMKQKRRGCRESLRLKLSVMTGVNMMYIRYAQKKALEVVKLLQKELGPGGDTRLEYLRRRGSEHIAPPRISSSESSEEEEESSSSSLSEDDEDDDSDSNDRDDDIDDSDAIDDVEQASDSSSN